MTRPGRLPTPAEAPGLRVEVPTERAWWGPVREECWRRPCIRLLATDDPQIGRRRRRRRIAPPELNHLEVVGGQSAERRIEHIVVPAPVHRPADVHVGAVVRDDQAVPFHRAEDPLHVRRERGDILARLQAQTRAERWRAAGGAGAMRRRPHVTVRGTRGDAEGVPDLTGRHLVVAHEAGKDRETGGVGRRPLLGAARVRRQIEYGTGARVPAACRGVPRRGKRLVEQPAIAIDDEQMAVTRRATAGLSPFDVVRRRPGFIGNGVTRQSLDPGITFIVVSECDRHPRLAAGDDDVGDAVWRWPEVGMEPANGGRASRGPAADPGDQLIGARVDRGGGNVLIPPVRQRKHLPSGERLEQHGRRRRLGGRECDERTGNGHLDTHGHLAFMPCAVATLQSGRRQVRAGRAGAARTVISPAAL